MTKRTQKESMHKAFDLYRRVKYKIDFYTKMRPDGQYGIAVDSDHYAIKWQQKRMTLEILEAYLSGHKPNWFHAKHIDNEEARRRNNES